MTTQAPISCNGLDKNRTRFFMDVVEGLGASPRALSPKYFYDGSGSLLFDAICELPEYYLTRTETSILRARARDIVSKWGSRVRVVEPGAGSGTKTRLILKALGADRCVEYIPVDIARDHLVAAAEQMRSEIPWLNVTPIGADFISDLPVMSSNDTTVVYFPGSTIGNFEPDDAKKLLARFARVAGPNGRVVLGVDLKKDPTVLHAAYNDSQGITAAFNKNVLVRINKELGGDFDLGGFAHYAFYEPTNGRVEMHLVSTRPQTVKVHGHVFEFGQGQSIRTEYSYKYDIPGLAKLARAAGLAVGDTWTDDENRFAVLDLVPLPA